MKMRMEKDSLGEKMIPARAYYGIQTLRAIENFPVSGRTESPVLIRAYMILKKATALANMELGTVDEERGRAILKAADEILEGKFNGSVSSRSFPGRSRNIF